MLDRHERLKELLKQSGYSVTTQRLAVYDTFQQQHQIKLADLLGMIASVDRASVYRIVDVYEKIGVLQRIQKGKESMLELSGVFADHHHHLYCVRCKDSIEIHGSPVVESELQAIAQAAGFVLQSHVVELTGLCASCQAISAN